VDLDKVLEFLESCKTQRTSATMVAGNLDRRIRGVRCSYRASPEPSLALAAGGPESGDEELLELFGALREIARRLESAAYAFISLEPTFGAFDSNFHSTELVLAGGAEPMWVTYLCDELAFEAYPYQILSPGHLRRLGGPPPGASALDQGRVELSIDQPSSWLLNASAYEPRDRKWFELGSRRRDPEVQQRARAILAPCLLSEREVPGKLLKQRYESQG